MRTVAAGILSLVWIFLSACASSDGAFKTDQEMINSLAENIDSYLSIAEKRASCPSASSVPKESECTSSIKSLDLVEYFYGENLGLTTYDSDNEFVESVENLEYRAYINRWGMGLDYNGYKKGYVYTYQTPLSGELWQGDLNTPAEEDSCGNIVRVVKIEDWRIDGNWYIYDIQYCS